MGIDFKFSKTIDQVIKDSGINDKALLLAATTAKNFMHEYVPMNTGALSKNVRVSAENGKGIIYYDQLYAGFCYYGEKKNFSPDKHEKATAYWDKAMLLTHGGILVKQVRQFIKKGRDNPK